MAAIAGAMTLGSCSNNDDDMMQTNVLPDDNAIAIASVTVGDAAAKTRAGMPTGELESGKSFGLFVTNAGASKYSYNNLYMVNPNGSWEAYTNNAMATPLAMLWQSATQPVTMIAYRGYYYYATLTNTYFNNLRDDQSTDGSEPSDFLYAKSVVTPNAPVPTNDIYYDAATKKVVVKFNHVLSKLRVALSYGTELTQDAVNLPTVTSVLLQGTILRYNINLSSETLAGVATVDNAITATDITMHPETLLTGETAAGVDAATEAIVVPQATVFTLRITLSNGKAYTYTYRNAGTSDKYTFESGKAYILNLTVGKDVVTPGSFTSSPWTTVNGGQLETE